MNTNIENTNVTTNLTNVSNVIAISGTIVSEPVFSHTVFGESFYLFSLEVKRMSDTHDIIPLMISERLTDISELRCGVTVKANGQFRSFNKHEESKNRLVLSVFVRDIEIIEDSDDSNNENDIFLDGFVCKAPIYRKTPLGREIADVLLAVNRPYGKSDYIPCICWGRNARFAERLEVGQRVNIKGRLQSRSYNKKIDEDNIVTRIAYEVSVSKIESIEQ